jgi:gamma-glutamyl:cysteine ligase YbdK (ATP-grasp superfamily)
MILALIFMQGLYTIAEAIAAILVFLAMLALMRFLLMTYSLRFQATDTEVEETTRLLKEAEYRAKQYGHPQALISVDGVLRVEHLQEKVQSILIVSAPRV